MCVPSRRVVLARRRCDLVEALLPRFGAELRHRDCGDEQQRRQAGEHRGQPEAGLNPQDLRHDNRGRQPPDAQPKPGALWGNFPQTYSMAGLILSAMRLSRSWEDRYWRG
jgi:hypothetical protein